ncbi:MAG TPA: GNAT family N-acyltransferase [Stellaceae bacterium]|jgi:putative hemolysin
MPVGIVEPPSPRLNAALAATQTRPPPRIVDLSAGPLQVRLAEARADIDAAQALRYRVFYETMGAQPTAGMAQRRRDFDPFDDICDHLLVIDRGRGQPPGEVVGTYRLIRRVAARRCGRFYSSGEYDIGNLVAHPGEILELGRSCVDPLYRGRAAMQLLWGGIAAYVFHYEIALMFGCASLPGTDPEALAEPLSYLRHEHLAPPELRVRALDERYVDMNRRDPAALDGARIRAALPPLIKGYLRLGGFVGDGAVIDAQFNTTDVCIVVKTDLVAEKYSRHYVRTVKDPWPA